MTVSTIKEAITKLEEWRGEDHVEIEVVELTPEIAQEWLAKNGENRPLRQHRVEKYAREMRNGNWVFNGESIKFDRKGEMIDGQHRCAAVIESGTTIKTLAVFGVSEETFATLDQGARRTAADVLSIEGEKDCHVLGSTLSLLRRYERGDLWTTNTGRRYVSGVEVLDTLDRHPEIRESVQVSNSTQRLISRSKGAFLHYVFSDRDADLADWFFDALATGIGVDKTDAVWHLRERFIKENAKREQMSHRLRMIYAIKAWNKHRADEDVKAIVWSEREGYPEIE